MRRARRSYSGRSMSWMSRVRDEGTCACAGTNTGILDRKQRGPESRRKRCGWWLLLADDDDHEGVGFDSGAGTGRGAWLSLGRCEVDAMGGRIHAHGAGADGGGDGLRDFPLAALVGGDGELAVSGAGEGDARGGGRGVHTGADGQGCFNLARADVHDDEVLRVAAADEEVLAGGIDGHADGTARRRDRPARDDRAGGEVDYRDDVRSEERRVGKEGR